MTFSFEFGSKVKIASEVQNWKQSAGMTSIDDGMEIDVSDEHRISTLAGSRMTPSGRVDEYGDVHPGLNGLVKVLAIPYSSHEFLLLLLAKD
jgi:hypothetical protein